ncbi:MAG TPA: hypothetical protein ENG33_07070 [Chloroflexi bacterium]|nr:hypothetical protein [Chloroflexota bacterium]
MSEMEMLSQAGDRNTQVNVADALLQIAQQLTQIAQTLNSQGSAPREAQQLEESAQKLKAVSQRVADSAEQTRQAAAETHERERLRMAILQELLRGAALPVELAAVTLSLPEEIQPVLEDLEREEMITIQSIQGGHLIRLTPLGRVEARRLQSRVRLSGLR